MDHPNKKFMLAAIKEAIKAQKAGDYAVGSVIVKNGRIISRGGQRVKRDNDPIQHAEIVAIKEAAKIFKSRHIEGCVLYTTHEPCPMCTSAAVWSKIKGIVYGTKISDMAEHREKNSNNEWLWRTIDIPCSDIIEKTTNKPFVIKEFMREECKKLFH